jgi:hypothetical protein
MRPVHLIILQTGDAIPRFTEKERSLAGLRYHRPDYKSQYPYGKLVSLTSRYGNRSTTNTSPNTTCGVGASSDRVSYYSAVAAVHLTGRASGRQRTPRTDVHLIASFPSLDHPSSFRLLLHTNSICSSIYRYLRSSRVLFPLRFRVSFKWTTAAQTHSSIIGTSP